MSRRRAGRWEAEGSGLMLGYLWEDVVVEDVGEGGHEDDLGGQVGVGGEEAVEEVGHAHLEERLVVHDLALALVAHHLGLARRDAAHTRGT